MYVSGLAQQLMHDRHCKIDLYNLRHLKRSQVYLLKISQIPEEFLIQVYIKVYP